MKYVLFIVCIFSFAFVSNGQEKSKLQLITSNKNYDNALKIKKIQELIASEKGKVQDTTLAKFYYHLAYYHQAEEEYEKALKYCDTIIYKKSTSFDLKIKFKERKALIYRAFGQIDNAVKLYLSILSALEEENDIIKSADINSVIGVIFLRMGELENAEYHLKESVRQARQVEDHYIEASSLMSLGNRFKNEGKLTEAEKYYKKSIEISKKENFERLLAGNYNNYGSLLRIKKEFDKAIKYYDLAVDINKKINNDNWLSYNYNNIGNIYNHQKKYQKALDYFFKSNEIKKRLNDVHGQYSTFRNIAFAYDSLGNYKQAYKYFVIYSKVKDSLRDAEQTSLTKKLAAEFQAEKKETEILQLKTQSKLDHEKIRARDERISYQKFLAWLMGIGILLVIAIAVIIWRSAINRKKANEQLVNQNAKIDAQHGEIIDSINYAKRIQSSILPNKTKLDEKLKSYGIFYKPKDIVSGDFYVCEETDKGVYFGTVDCTGHGVPGAMVSLVASAHINEALHKLSLIETDDILNNLNTVIPKALNDGDSELNDGFDIALCRLSNDFSTLQFSGANLNCWVYSEKREGESRFSGLPNVRFFEENNHVLIEVKGTRGGIGKSQNIVTFEKAELKLRGGDKIIISTDGFKDQFGGFKNKKFNVKEMRNIILQNGTLTPKDLSNKLESALVSWQGSNEQVDDICLMVVEV